jgi:nucleoside-diphosphate-sugar epimerase
MHILIAGAGDLGQRVALTLRGLGHTVCAVRRTPQPQCIAADVRDKRAIAPLVHACDAIVFCATPDQRSEQAYQALYLDGISAVLAARISQHVVFCSSTAVYHENNGGWVDETTPCAPEAFNGRVLLAAEALLAQGDVALRLSGLYGPNRDFARRQALSDAPGLANHWTNRVHVADAAAAVVFALQSAYLPAPPGYAAILNVTDFFPCTQHQHYSALRLAAGLQPLPAHELNAPTSGKRVSNATLTALGLHLAHPTFFTP